MIYFWKKARISQNSRRIGADHWNFPFKVEDMLEGESLYVSLLAEEPSQQRIDQLLSYNNEIDHLCIQNQEVYILYRQSLRDSKFSNNFIEKKFGVSATTMGSFFNRFAIGFLTAVVVLPVTGWLKGIVVGLLFGLPDAIITNAYAPIILLGVLGGAAIGLIVG